MLVFMRTAKTIVFLTVLLPLASHALSVDQYSRLEQGQNRTAAENYMAGVADAISAIRKSEQGDGLSCAPEGTRFTTEQVSRHYRDYLRTYPQVRKQLTGDVTAADIVLEAYAAQYCGRAGRSGRAEEQTPHPLSPLPQRQ